jgi:hypothetical protein
MLSSAVDECTVFNTVAVARRRRARYFHAVHTNVDKSTIFNGNIVAGRSKLIYRVARTVVSNTVIFGGGG